MLVAYNGGLYASGSIASKDKALTKNMSIIFILAALILINRLYSGM